MTVFDDGRVKRATLFSTLKQPASHSASSACMQFLQYEWNELQLRNQPQLESPIDKSFHIYLRERVDKK